MSRICQEALSRAVRIEEMRSQVDEDIEKLATVWSEERKENSREFYEEGFQDGIKDACKTDYAWMCHVAYIQDDDPENVFKTGATKDTMTKFEENAFETSLPYDGYTEDDARTFYVEGWVDGFVDVWQRVCTKLSIHGF